MSKPWFQIRIWRINQTGMNSISWTSMKKSPTLKHILTNSYSSRLLKTMQISLLGWRPFTRFQTGISFWRWQIVMMTTPLKWSFTKSSTRCPFWMKSPVKIPSNPTWNWLGKWTVRNSCTMLQLMILKRKWGFWPQESWINFIYTYSSWNSLLKTMI